MPDGPHDAAFRTVRLEKDAVPAGRLFFCHHLTPELVWHDAWRRHANGALGIARAVVCATDPGQLGALFTQMFGPDSVTRTPTGITLAAGLARIDVVTPSTLMAEFGDAAPLPAGRDQFMAALVLRTASLSRAAGALRDGGITAVSGDGVLTVPASDLGGMTLQFTE